MAETHKRMLEEVIERMEIYTTKRGVGEWDSGFSLGIFASKFQ